MKTGLKIFVNAALIFTLVGFATYIFILIVGFFGCCAGISDYLFQNIVNIIFIAGAVTFGISMYNNCYQSLKKNFND